MVVGCVMLNLDLENCWTMMFMLIFEGITILLNCFIQGKTKKILLDFFKNFG